MPVVNFFLSFEDRAQLCAWSEALKFLGTDRPVNAASVYEY